MTSLTDERQRRLVLDSLWLGIAGAVAAQLFMLLDIAQKLFLEKKTSATVLRTAQAHGQAITWGKEANSPCFILLIK